MYIHICEKIFSLFIAPTHCDTPRYTKKQLINVMMLVEILNQCMYSMV